MKKIELTDEELAKITGGSITVTAEDLKGMGLNQAQFDAIYDAIMKDPEYYLTIMFQDNPMNDFEKAMAKLASSIDSRIKLQKSNYNYMYDFIIASLS